MKNSMWTGIVNGDGKYKWKWSEIYYLMQCAASKYRQRLWTLPYTANHHAVIFEHMEK
jgi:hypothetical protein